MVGRGGPNVGGPFDLSFIISGSNQAGPALTQAGQQVRTLGQNAKASSIELFSMGFVLRELSIGLRTSARFFTDFSKTVVMSAAAFDHQMRRVWTQVDDGVASLQELKTVAMDVARRMPQDAETIADSMFFIFSSTDFSLREVTHTVEQFAKAAVAGFTDMGTVAKGTLPILNAWGLRADSVTRVLDIQFQMVRRGIGSYQDFANALGQVIPSAKSAGQTIEQLGALMAFTTRMGLNTRMAATAVGRAFDLITRPEIVLRMQRLLNVDVIDKATGGYRQMSAIVTDLAARFRGLTEPQIVDALTAVFGRGEIRAMRFFKTAIPNFELMNSLVNEFSNSAGAMEEAFDKAFASLQNQIEVVRFNFRALGIQLGTTLVEDTVKVLKEINRLLDALHATDPAFKRSIMNIALMTGGFLTLATAVTSVAIIVFRWQSLMLLAGRTIFDFLRLLGPMAAVVGVLGLAVFSVAQNWDRFSRILGGSQGKFEELVQAVDKLLQAVLNALAPAMFNFVLALVHVAGAITPLITAFAKLAAVMLDNEIVASALAGFLAMRFVFSIAAYVAGLMRAIAANAQLTAAVAQQQGVLFAQQAAMARTASISTLFATGISRASLAVRAFAVSIGPIGWLLIGVATGLTLYQRKMTDARNSTRDFIEMMEKLHDSDPGEAVRRLTIQIDRMQVQADKARGSLVAWGDAATATISPVSALSNVINRVVQWRQATSQVDELTMAKDRLAKQAEATKNSLIDSIPNRILKERIGEAMGDMEALDEAQQALIDRAKQVSDGIKKAFDPMKSIFEEFADQAHVSASSVSESMNKQLEAFSNFYKNLQTLKDAGVSDKLIADLAQEGLSASGIVNGLVDDLKNNNGEYVKSISDTREAIEGLGESAAGEFVSISEAASKSLGVVRDELGQIVSAVSSGTNEVTAFVHTANGIQKIKLDPAKQSIKEIAAQLNISEEGATALLAKFIAMNKTTFKDLGLEFADIKAALGGDSEKAQELIGKLGEIDRSKTGSVNHELALLELALGGDKDAAIQLRQWMDNVDRAETGKVRYQVGEMSREIQRATAEANSSRRAIENMDKVRFPTLNDALNGIRSILGGIGQAARNAFNDIGRVSNASPPPPRDTNAGGIPRGVRAPRRHEGGQIYRYHFGGLRANEMPAVLQLGEFVLDRDTVNAIGLSNLMQRKSMLSDQGPQFQDKSGPTINATIQGRFDSPEEIVNELVWSSKTGQWD